MKRMKKENKGFTLVELIVVLVILAILAAILVPALLGYIDRARQQQIVLNARSCYTAAQAELSSMYGQNVDPSELTSTSDYATSILNTADVPDCTALEIGCEDADNKTLEHDDYTVAYVKYTENSQTIYFNGSAWVEDEPDVSALNVYTIK